MKINFSHIAILICVSLFPACLHAQTVVRTDGRKVYIDTSSLGRSVRKGDPFKIILSSEKLVNPKTGKDLGLVYTYSSEGAVTEVQPLYAVGELPSEEKISVGQEAVFETAQAPAPADVSAKTQHPQDASSYQTKVYDPVEQEIIGLSEAAVTGDGAKNIVTLSSKGRVSVWTRDGEKLKENFFYQLPAGKTPVALSAGALRGGAADVFVTVYDAARERISTVVLTADGAALKETDTLPYFVKELGCGTEKRIWAQKAFVSGAYPGNARNVVFQNGKFELGTDSFNTQRNWLCGVNRSAAEKEGAENLFYTSANGRIRMTLSGGKRAESKDLFAATPNRVKYKQTFVKFYPSLQVFGPNGNVSVAAAANAAKYGLLSDTFGQYQSAKIHFMNFEKGRLSITGTVPLDGFVYDTACTDDAVLTAEVLPDGTSSVVEIFR